MSEVLTTSVRIAASPDVVFPYFTDPALLVQWLGDWAELDPVAGGGFAVNMAATAVRGEYVEVDPPHRVVFTWGVPGREGLGPGSTTVEVVLTQDGAETLVELSHHGLPEDQIASHRSGWAEKLVALSAAV